MIGYRSAAMLDRLTDLRSRPWLVGLLVALAAQILFTVHLDRPGIIQFDETHYVPAARSLLLLDQARNTEHPLVAKELIALGMAVFGDNVWGWRLPSTLAGSATVAGVFAILWLLLGRMRFALAGAVFVALNQLLYVQARIAMLDVFLGAFLVWAMVAFLAAMRAPPNKVLMRWIAGSVLLGLAVGVKWAAIPYVALAGLAFVTIRLIDARRSASRPAQPQPQPQPQRGMVAAALAGKGQPHWPGLATLPGLLLMGAVSITVYFLTYLPAFFYAYGAIPPGEIVAFQFKMYEAQTQVLSAHTYESDWWSWPLMLRPIWYFYEFEGGAQRGVLLIGNPVIMWGGLVAVAACYWAWFRSKAIVPLAMALLWTASLAIYIVIPKSLGFYYYYHLSGIFLALVLAVAFHHFDGGKRRGLEEWFGGAALLAFIYFYPILSAAPLSGGDAFEFWMWFPSWR
ncbi:phospholipid carrier-dependent glycosyltransferase [Sphingosinithalassobacter sp. CS137]|uniref:phospholipid carrier-dependent glycosyltransferase n=1 Tax=Sphingosinithalassobacter sp. CS137 TaxID=2762748 RepID=UPI0021D2A279|nr:phospholipid carrier-dependent glycosyltransferase [Sphingosinithalassobacter sp. CS137]